FFVEELARTMQTHELLTVQGNVYEIVVGAHTTLPASVQGLIQARLDQVPGEAKLLLQMAAVNGTEISLPVVDASVEWPEDQLHQSLTHLQAAELLYEMHATAVRTYTFKHALVQDATYQTLLPSTRQQYHGRIGQVLAEHFPEVAKRSPN